MQTSRSSIKYTSKKDDNYLITKLSDLSIVHPREGFWKCYYRLRNKGEKVNHKRLHRVYKQMNLPLRRKVKKRLPARIKESIEVPDSFAKSWSIDFMSDALESGRKFRSFNVMDDYNREILHIETDYSIKSSRVIWILNHLINKNGKPKKIRMDNGPEFIAKLAQEWSEIHQITFQYIQPGKPTQNALIERFNKTYRDNILDTYLFSNIEEVRDETERFTHDYNHERPHDALNGLSPKMYMNKHQKQQIGEFSYDQATPSLH